jgi:hypothetical protein
MTLDDTVWARSANCLGSRGTTSFAESFSLKNLVPEFGPRLSKYDQGQPGLTGADFGSTRSDQVLGGQLLVRGSHVRILAGALQISWRWLLVRGGRRLVRLGAVGMYALVLPFRSLRLPRASSATGQESATHNLMARGPPCEICKPEYPTCIAGAPPPTAGLTGFRDRVVAHRAPPCGSWSRSESLPSITEVRSAPLVPAGRPREPWGGPTFPRPIRSGGLCSELMGWPAVSPIG